MTTSPAVPAINRYPPPGEQMATYYRGAIRDGRLKPGDMLPANRRLAAEWGVSTPTALRVTTILTREGWIETRPGRPPVVLGDPT